MLIRAFALLVAIVVVVAGVVVAQLTTGATEDNDSKPPAVPKQAVEKSAPALPHVAELMVLLRSTLLAVDQANQTGNYTVLRDLGTPNFQRANDAARLTENFQIMRNRKVDISAIAVLNAKLVQQPSIDAEGTLRLTGFFPSRPEQVNFDVSFQMVDGRWRLSAMALNTTRNELPIAATGPTPQPPEPDNAPEATKEAAVSDPAMTPDQKAPSEEKASAASTAKPVSAPEASADIRDEVDRLEEGPARAKAPKPAPQQSFNPFASF